MVSVKPPGTPFRGLRLEGMSAHLILLRVVFILIAASSLVAQAKGSAEQKVRRLFAATSRGSTEEREVARKELDTLTRSSWGSLYSLYTGTKDPDLKKMLRYQLGLARAQECEVILRGKVSRVEHAQGGVVDHHDLVVHFDGRVEVMKGAQIAKDHLAAPTMFRIARGTHRDTWLCELIEKEILRQPRDGVWLLKSRTLRYGYGTVEVTFQHFEIHRLPPEAVRARQELTGTSTPKRRK